LAGRKGFIVSRLSVIAGIVSIGVVIYMGVAVVDMFTAEMGTPVRASSEVAVPIMPEDVMFSEMTFDPASAFEMDPQLALLADSGSAVVEAHTNRDRIEALTADNSNLLARLRTTESSFRGGIGLEGAAMVNGKAFSWANVNMSNISWG
jgi:hypothetical protein